jgi:diguanylate cyclase (GGDEF)-like protein/PAS domain S-box-containing protein
MQNSSNIRALGGKPKAGHARTSGEEGGRRNDGPVIGVLSPLLSGTYFGELLKGMSSYAESVGGRVVAVQTLDASVGDHYLGPSLFRDRVAWQLVDGFVVITRAAPDDYLLGLWAAGKPLVLVSHHVEGLPCPEVRPDNRSAVAEAVCHLYDHGHRRIAFAGDLSNADAAERFDGYQEGLDLCSLGRNAGLLLPSVNLLEEGGESAAEVAIRLGMPCTALVTANDQVAFGLIKRFKAEGLRVPEDIAVVGFDDVDYASQSAPALASIRQNFDKVSETAARLVIEMAGGASVAAQEYRVPAALVPRESCGCPRQFLPTDLGWLVEDGSLEHLLAGAVPSSVPTGSPLAHAIIEFSEAYESALAGSSSSLAPLGRAAAELFWAYPRAELLPAVMSALSRYRSEAISRGLSRSSLERLELVTNEALLSLCVAQQRMLAAANDQLQASLRNEYYVSMGLVGLRLGSDGLRSENVDARSLHWLQGTQARNACLGLWEAAGQPSGRKAARRGRREAERSEREALQVAGTYGDACVQALSVGTHVELTAFPPFHALDAGRRLPGEIIAVLPVRTASHDWGYFAVASPPETAAKTGRDTFFQWAALVGVALDHEALLASLEEQRSELALAYERERQLRSKVKLSEERYALAASAVNDGIWDWDLLEGEVFYSRRWKALLGYDDASIGNSPEEWFSRCHPDDARHLAETIATCTTGEKETFSVEHRLICSNGQPRWFLCRARAVKGRHGKVERVVGSLTDITEQKHLQEELVKAAHYDALTCLPNRALFMQRLQASVERARTDSDYKFGLVFVDLDDFKLVNDTYGHVFGDRLLEAVAKRLVGELRESDLPVRFGGDEFGVLLEELGSVEDIDRVAARLQAALCRPYLIEGRQLTVTATVGVAGGLGPGGGVEDLVRRADQAMYRAKANKPRLLSAVTGARACTAS